MPNGRIFLLNYPPDSSIMVLETLILCAQGLNEARDENKKDERKGAKPTGVI